MPNAKVLESKKAVVAALTERVNAATSGVFVDYKGITVDEDTELRNELRKAGVEYTVVKNTMTRFAVKEAGYTEFDELLNGTTSLATTTGDPLSSIYAVGQYAKKLNGKFEIKGGFMEGKALPLSEIMELSELPSKEGLLSQVLGTLLAPITSLAVVLDQIVQQKGGAPAEAPAGE